MVSRSAFIIGIRYVSTVHQFIDLALAWLYRIHISPIFTVANRQRFTTRGDRRRRLWCQLATMHTTRGLRAPCSKNSAWTGKGAPLCTDVSECEQMLLTLSCSTDTILLHHLHNNESRDYAAVCPSRRHVFLGSTCPLNRSSLSRHACRGEVSR